MNRILVLLALAALPFGFALAGEGGKCEGKCAGDCAKCEKCEGACDGCPESALKALAAARDERAKAAEALKALPAEKRTEIEAAQKTIIESPMGKSMVATMAATVRLLGVVEAIDAKAGLSDKPCGKLAAELRSTLCEVMKQERAAANADDAAAAIAAAEAAMKQAEAVEAEMEKLPADQTEKVMAAFKLCGEECPTCRACGSSMEAYGMGMTTLAALEVEMPANADAKLWELRGKCLETATALMDEGCCGMGEDCCEDEKEEGCCPSEKPAGECPVTGKTAS